MAQPPALLKLISVCKRFDSKESAEPLQILRDLSLEAAPGEAIAVTGPSGCGKSTLLNIIGTLDRPTSGQVFLGERDLSLLRDDELAEIRSRQIGFIFQAHHLLPHCTVLENVLVPLLAPKGAKPGAPDEERARQLIERVGLGGRFSHRPAELSGGERQRVAVVRALINQPRLLLADEPTGSLDRAAAQELARLLLELNRENGIALIVVTHAMDLARQMGRVLELRDGQLK